MNSVWQQVALSNFPHQRWKNGSYVYRLVGCLHHWRESSWLLQWTEPLGVLILAAAMVLGPFVSTALIGVLLIAGGGYWGLVTLSDDPKTVFSPIHLLVLLYWAIATIAFAFSPVKQAAFSGWVELTLYLLLFALAARVLQQPGLRSGLMTVVMMISLVVSAYGIRQERFGVEQLATWNDPSSELAQDTRVYSYLGNPNLLAGYLLTAIALSLAAIWIWKTWTQKALALITLSVNLACLYFTDSRGGWIAALALLFTFLLLLRFWWGNRLPQFWRTWLLPLVFGFLISFLVVAILLVEPLRLRVASIFAGRGDSSNNFRINVWEAVFQMIRDHPFIGIGPGNDAFKQVYPLYMRTGYTALSAYSIFLEIIVELGYLGLVSFLWLLLVIFNQGVKSMIRLRNLGSRQGLWAVAAMAAMAGMLAHGVVDTVWYRPQINTLWWLMVAVVASFYPQPQDSTNH